MAEQDLIRSARENVEAYNIGETDAYISLGGPGA